MDHQFAAQMASLANDEIAQDEYEPQQDDGGTTGKKRKADDGQPQQRAKRNRYISIACNECKRRKIKCNGQSPCQRCGNLNLECVYAPNCCNGFKDSAEYREMAGHMDLLQEQVNALYHEVNSLRAQLGQGMPLSQQQQPPPHSGPIDPSLQTSPFPSHRGSYVPAQASPGAGLVGPVSPNATRRKSHSQSEQPSFRGPTSNSFNFGVARSSLQTMGISSIDEGTGENGTQDPSPAESPRMRQLGAQLVQSMHADKDPIWSVSKEEALRLCHVYEDEMGLMYPIMDISKVVQYAHKLYRFMEAAHRSGLMQQGLPGADSIEDEDTNILKLVLASAMIIEGSGRSQLGQRMFEYVQPAVDNMLLGNVDIKGLRLLILTAMYEFQRDNEGISWRLVGHTARLCIELGLHRRETYEAIQDEGERAETILLFWAIYVLDRRWSFGTGMPFVLQDSDIDSQVPKPEDRSPYLSAMIDYCAIGARVWRAVAGTTPPSAGGQINTDEMDYLDFQVIQWHNNIPAHLRFEHPSQRVTTPVQPSQSRAGHRLRILLYLRANQMRIHIYRPILQSATSIMQHRKQAQIAIDVAKDTIRVLTHINQSSDLYRTQQALFNAFLTSALAVLFLAVAHTPALFATEVREEFYMALDLVRGFSKGSWIGKRLWKTIRVLKEVGPKLGLGAPKSDDHGHGHARSLSQQQLDPNRSAAVAMAGLAGHNVDEMALMQGGGGQAWSVVTGESSSPSHMANDLTNLFEVAQAFQALSNGSGNGSGGQGQQGEEGIYGVPGAGEGTENMAHVYGGDDGLSNILKELF